MSGSFLYRYEVTTVPLILRPVFYLYSYVFAGMVTHSLGMLVIPSIMALNFVFNIIPSLDRYLEKKYKDEFRDYSKKAKKFIPLIY